MSGHILVVEDDAFIATIFEKILARMGQYTVTVTDDAERVLALVRERQVQLVIMDVSLSRSTYQAEAVDGIALTRLIKQAADAGGLPVLLVTAHAMPGDAERLLAARLGSDLVDHFSYVIAGDGCLMEGISLEAISLAGHLKLGKLIVFFDDNSISIDGATSLAVSDDQLARFAASGWNVMSLWPKSS